MMDNLHTFVNTVSNLTVGDVFEYYDFPLLYVALLDSQPRYLVIFAGEDKTGTHKFAHVPIDTIKLTQLKAGECSIRSVFQQPKGGVVYIHETHPNVPPFSYAIAEGSLGHDLLLEDSIPDDDIFLGQGE